MRKQRNFRVRALSMILVCTLFATMVILPGCGAQTTPEQTPNTTEPTQATVATPSVIQQRRDMAESYMRSMATYMWRSDKDVFYTRDAKVLTEEDLQSYTGAVLKIYAGRLYRGIPSSYTGASAWNFYDFASEPDEKGIHTMSGIHWRNLNGTAAIGAIMGNDCSSSIQQSWDYAGSGIQSANTSYMTTAYGYLRVGNYASSDSENDDSEHLQVQRYRGYVQCLQPAFKSRRCGKTGVFLRSHHDDCGKPSCPK